MTMTYGDLNLKELREKLNLNFAHYTYEVGKCSCCYGPSDLSSVYWKDQEVIGTEDARWDSVSFIQFKNAENGRGIVTKSDVIGSGVQIEHKLTEEQMDAVCVELSAQVNPYGYTVKKPETHMHCIEIVKL